jgi:hypothetical protein
MLLDSDRVNTQLAEAYDRALPVLLSARSRHLADHPDTDMSWPFLVCASPSYAAARVRLMIVGRETNGWGDGPPGASLPIETVEQGMRIYRNFDLGRGYHSSAFWTFGQQLVRTLNAPEGPDFVTSNAFRLDERDTTPGPVLQASLSAADRNERPGLLRREITILQPHVLVLAAGPEADEALSEQLPELGDLGMGPITQLDGAELAPIIFRCWHPSGLNRRQLLGQAIAQIDSFARRTRPDLFLSS